MRIVEKDMLSYDDPDRPDLRHRRRSPDRLDAIRQRMLSGAYNTPEVLGCVAIKILECRDL
jgi:hypothetical protein